MWPFTLTRSVTLSKSIPTTKDRLLSVLHDPQQALRTSPLITSLDQEPNNPDWYELTEKVPILGEKLVQTNHLKVHYVKTEDGYDAEVFAAAWTRLKSQARAKEAGEAGKVVYEEQLTVEGLFFLMPFIVSTMTKTHQQVLNVVAERALQSTACAVLLTSLAMWSRAKQRPGTSDPYGLFHLTLNRLPGQDPNLPPETEWLNMGYWKDAKSFPEACRTLAMKLIKAGKLKRGGRVLDVGHGTGESLLLLISEPTIPRPSHLVGITSLDSHHLRSLDRVRKYQAAHKSEDVNVDLYQADAVFDEKGTNHPLRMSLPFDSILALDCAYHFNTRRRFLEQSFQNLAPDGHIALADIYFSSSSLQSWRTKFLTSVLRLMPKENVISSEDYISQMQEIGYEDVILQDITSNVFPGFSAFLKSRKWGWWILGLVIDWYASAGAKFVIVSGRKPL